MYVCMYVCIYIYIFFFLHTYTDMESSRRSCLPMAAPWIPDSDGFPTVERRKGENGRVVGVHIHTPQTIIYVYTYNIDLLKTTT